MACSGRLEAQKGQVVILWGIVRGLSGFRSRLGILEFQNLKFEHLQILDAVVTPQWHL